MAPSAMHTAPVVMSESGMPWSIARRGAPVELRTLGSSAEQMVIPPRSGVVPDVGPAIGVVVLGALLMTGADEAGITADEVVTRASTQTRVASVSHLGTTSTTFIPRVAPCYPILVQNVRVGEGPTRLSCGGIHSA